MIAGEELQAPAIGKEPTPAWMGAELMRVGNFDPRSPDKRGKWKMLPLDGIELKTGREFAGPYSPGAPDTPATRGPGGDKMAFGGEAQKPVRIDQIMTELRIRPSHAMTVIREVLRVVFEVATVRIHKFHFSLGELVGLAKYDETFNIPYHTQHEKQHIAALRSLCAKHLDLLSKSRSKKDFDGIASIPAWKKEYRDLMERVMQSMPSWQSSAVLTFWKLNSRMVDMRDETEATRRGRNNFHNRKTPKDLYGFCTTVLTANEEYVRLEQEVGGLKLDLEWYDRLCLVHKRDRRYLREELDLYFENALLHKKYDAAHVEVRTCRVDVCSLHACPGAARLRGKKLLEKSMRVLPSLHVSLGPRPYPLIGVCVSLTCSTPPSSVNDDR